MPDRPLQMAAYAAGASLAAATLVYVFAPTFFLDDGAAQSTRSSRKRGVVGLSNPANDCFINSVLQVLAGLPELRLHLIRETHLRFLGGEDVYGVLPPPPSPPPLLPASTTTTTANGQEESVPDPVAPFKDVDDLDRGKRRLPDWKVLGLQRGQVTLALKEVLDALNERPIYKKTLSAQGFVEGLQAAFRTRINRSQQDAQEFLQLVTERLWEEHRAGKAARWRMREAGRRAAGLGQEKKSAIAGTSEQGRTEINGAFNDVANNEHSGVDQETEQADDKQEVKDDDDGTTMFPFEGKIESQIECLHCHFKPRPTISSFVTLTLHVPQGNSGTTLSACFDGVLKIEHIDDFKCARCRIQHAVDAYKSEITRTTVQQTADKLRHDLTLLEECLLTDPEKPPKSVALPEITLAPKRKISRHSRISSFPSVLAIHLSRSVWDGGYSSSKNHAKVSFPETLPLGGLLEHVTYRLRGLITHKGIHQSGHYETYRRQFLREAYSTPTSMGTAGAYSDLPTLTRAGMSTTSLKDVASKDAAGTSSTDATPSGFASPSELQRSTTSTASAAPPSTPTESSISTASQTSTTSNTEATTSATSLDTLAQASSHSTETAQSPTLRKKPSMSSSAINLARKTRAKRDAARWWRISDDRIKECSTRDVLKMEREVYLLFYELVPAGTRS